jgi:hypothetical protein
MEIPLQKVSLTQLDEGAGRAVAMANAILKKRSPARRGAHWSLACLFVEECFALLVLV